MSACSLQNMRDEFWGDLVTVVLSDMRRWQAPELADIIVSELLGSFGDNELSPECLDGAQCFLKGSCTDSLAICGWLKMSCYRKTFQYSIVRDHLSVTAIF